MLLQSRVKVFRASTSGVDLLPTNPYVSAYAENQAHALAPQTRSEAQNESQELLVAARLAESTIPKTSQPRAQTCTQGESTKPPHPLRQRQTVIVTAMPPQAPRRREDGCRPEFLLFTNLGSSSRARASPLSGNRCSRRSEWLQQTTDRLNQSRNMQVCYRHRDDRIGAKIRPCQVATARKEHQRDAVEKSIPRCAAKPPEALTTQGTHDCAGVRPTRTAVPATAPQAPSHSLDDRQ